MERSITFGTLPASMFSNQSRFIRISMIFLDASPEPYGQGRFPVSPFLISSLITIGNSAGETDAPVSQYGLPLHESVPAGHWGIHFWGKGGASVRFRTHRLSEALPPDAGTQ